MKYSYKDFKNRIVSFLERRVLPAQVSVIVPVYNGEETISNCLDCLINQSQKKIKIICVDDGSTDNTLSILKRYRRKYHRIQIIHQKNGGRSVARNTGLSVVKTKYVMFCDDEDEFDFYMCEGMLKAIKKNKVDLAICGIDVIYNAHEEMKASDDNYYKLDYKGKQRICDDLIVRTDASICNKIFRVDIIREYNITFPKGLNNEDFYFYNAYMCVAEMAFFLEHKLYRYFRRDESIMSDNFKKKSFSVDHLLIAEKLFTFLKKNGILMERRNLFWRQWIASFWFTYEYSAIKYRPEIRNIVKAFLGKNYEKYEPDYEWARKSVADIQKILNNKGVK